MSNLLRAKGQLSGAADFEILFQVVKTNISPIRKIGELACYDIAHRIGAYLHIYPDDVYLHAGTRAGAKALGIKAKTNVIQVTALPPEFRRLTAAQIEDCLCIFKTELAAMNRS